VRRPAERAQLGRQVGSAVGRAEGVVEEAHVGGDRAHLFDPDRRAAVGELERAREEPVLLPGRLGPLDLVEGLELQALAVERRDALRRCFAVDQRDQRAQ
jgi:hypothetical protein